ncbi:hypothetical protein IFM89_016900 [Coptis chinensis]|uniref:Uncharacterized protein n=1 Tax=Coptis chinensis TaxID=261450 RepID=A0A835I2T3_9MAGN|nr:hypothetical protein IFM89_016900 [Coptis chinensis]
MSSETIKNLVEDVSDEEDREKKRNTPVFEEEKNIFLRLPAKGNQFPAYSLRVEYVGLSPSVPLLATGSLDENLIIWDMQNSVAHFTCVHKVGVSCLAWLGKSQYILHSYGVCRWESIGMG